MDLPEYLQTRGGDASRVSLQPYENSAETKEQCEIKLTEMIERVKAEIAEEKVKLKEGAE